LVSGLSILQFSQASDQFSELRFNISKMRVKAVQNV